MLPHPRNPLTLSCLWTGECYQRRFSRFNLLPTFQLFPEPQPEEWDAESGAGWLLLCAASLLFKAGQGQAAWECPPACHLQVCAWREEV